MGEDGCWACRRAANARLREAKEARVARREEAESRGLTWDEEEEPEEWQEVPLATMRHYASGKCAATAPDLMQRIVTSVSTIGTMARRPGKKGGGEKWQELCARAERATAAARKARRTAEKM